MRVEKQVRCGGGSGWWCGESGSHGFTLVEGLTPTDKQLQVQGGGIYPPSDFNLLADRIRTGLSPLPYLCGLLLQHPKVAGDVTTKMHTADADKL